MPTEDEFDVAGDVGAQVSGVPARPVRWNGALTWVLAGAAAIVVGVALTPGVIARDVAPMPAPAAEVVVVMDTATGAMAEVEVAPDPRMSDTAARVGHPGPGDDWLCGPATDDRMRCTRVPDGTVVVLDAEGNVVEVTIQVQR